MTKLAIIRIRGEMKITAPIKDTMRMLNLQRKHACIIIEDTPINKGMVQKVKDYVTFGEIDAETEKLLIEKRGKTDSEGKPKKYFALHPPKGGFERKGIKVPFTMKGALGYRGKEINTLIKKML